VTTASRPLRSLVPVEVLVVLALAVAPLPAALPIALPLFVAASISLWIRGRSWGGVVHASGLHAAGGAIAGVAAILLGVLVGAPIIEATSQRMIEWSMFPIVRGNVNALGGVVIMTAISALCLELALRGWIVERVLELSPGPAVLPILVGALAEALLTPGDLAARIGGALFGIGLGWMYVAAGRNVMAPVLARMTFSVVAVILEAMRVIG